MASREEKKAATRKKLLDAAASLVAKEGALATSLDAIAEKAGLTKGAVYSNFTSKEDLIEALAGRAIAIQAQDVFNDVSRPLGVALEDLGREISATFRGASSRTWLLTYEILNYALHNAGVRRDIAESWRVSRAETAEWFDRASETHGRELALSGVELSLVIEALALGVAQLHAIDSKAVPEDLLPRALRLLAG